MTPQELVHIFKDTQSRIHADAVLHGHSLRAQAASRLYLEGYVSPIRRIKGPVKAFVCENTTFRCAGEYAQTGLKIAVLNFASPYEPGGGVLRGAMAQEECLCRVSSLYDALAQPYFQKHYYQYHMDRRSDLFSDRIIYSPLITIIKSDDAAASLLAAPFVTDVITCAAPYIRRQMNEHDLYSVYLSRIRNILETAMGNDIDILILGAFGCGAFHNPPQLMAKAFHHLLIQEKYAQYFRKVVFAIKRSGTFCRNLHSFGQVFCGESKEEKNRNA